MKKRNYLKYLVFGIAALSLVSCAKVPDEINSQLKDKKKYSQTTEDGKVKLNYVEVNQVLDDFNKVIDSTYNNLTFSKDIILKQPEEMGRYTFTQASNFAQNAEAEISSYFGEKYDGKKLLKDETGYEYDDKENKNYYALLDNGFYSVFKNQYYDVLADIDHGVISLEKSIDLFHDYDDSSYELEDGKMKISEAIRQAGEYAKDLYKKSNDFDWKPRKISVYQKKNKKYFFKLEFEKEYRNVAFTAVSPDLYNCKDEDNKYIPYTKVTNPFIFITSKNEPEAYANPSGVISSDKEIEKYDKVISLQTAADIVSKELAEYTKYNVVRMNIENRLVRTNNLANINEECLSDVDYTKGNTYESQPYWVFYFDVTEGREIYAMVNCISGKFEFWDKAIKENN